MSQMEKVIFTHFRQKRKTFDNRKVLGPFFDQNRKNANFPLFGAKKGK